MGGTDMEHDRYWSWLLVFLSAAVMVLSGCSTGGDTAREDPVQDSDLAGVWVGWFDATKAQPAFCVGMIVDDGDGYTARFIGDDRQYVSPIIGLFGTVFPFDVQPLEATSGTGFFFGDLAEFAWTGSGQDYATNVEKIYLSGTVAAKNSLGLPWGGAFRYYDEQDVLTNDTGAFVYIYNTTFDQVPNVRNLGGKWVIRNAWQAGNTLRLTITPDPVVTNTMSAVISGSDSMGNTFSGSITINVSPVPHNVYDVSLGMNRNAINLTGLATYVLEMSDEDSGIEIARKTLAIGASSGDFVYTVGGLATQE